MSKHSERKAKGENVIRKKRSILYFVLTIALVTVNCMRDSPVRGIEVEVSFSDTPLTDKLYTEIQYTWRMKRNFKKIDQNLVAFVHFWHGSNLIFHDNHRPEIPVSTWEPSQEYSYTRRIYIPLFIDALDPEFKGTETLKLSIGLSFPEDKSGKPLKKVYEKKLKVYPPPADIPKIVYDEGWFDFEIDPESYLKRWRWTAKEARCVVDNPHRGALLVIKGGVEKDVLQDQKVIVRIDDRILEEFIPGRDRFEKFYRIDKEMLGEKEQFSLIISTDKTFIPARVNPDKKDERELGVKVSFIYFR
ncbi:MAG: hypothetical protein JSV46_04275 [Candidatus Aminicenantes bacterium]|nr:MAG: hypothetical protein JSV46_04275 [Candidatus Aminicenantes bacterium]